MSKNKHALTRFHALDKCFSNTGRNYTIDDLLAECNAALEEVNPGTAGIQKRQLYDDIKYMQDPKGYNVELKTTKIGRNVYYRYADPDFSIFNKGLDETEMAKITAALTVVSRFKGMPQFEWVEEVIAKFESRFGVRKGAEKIIGFDENLDYTAVKNITPLFNAILYQQVLNVTYRDFKSEKPYEVTFHPYYLKQYNNRWFCLGLKEKGKMISNLALDRIIEMNVIKKKYIANEINFDEYFEEVIGVTVQGDTQKVKLKVVSSLWPYVETKPLHGTQKVIKKEKDGVIISIEVKLNYELQSLILSHGEKMTVLEPEILRNVILSRVRMIQ